MRQVVEEQFAIDARTFLTAQPRQLPSRYFYDEVGSALFEVICRLAWYPITRAERRLLARHRSDVFRHIVPARVVELGSGSGDKLRMLLEAAEVAGCPVDVHLVDLSRAALEQSASTLAVLGNLRVTRHETTYENGLIATAGVFAPSDRVLVLFLGSNIGNFDPEGRAVFLARIRKALRPGDALLIGVDLVKSREALELAYADPLGVTAAFNKNLLVRVNRELGANFDLEGFAHRAVWNEEMSRVEMHLVAERDQVVRVAAADLEFRMREGEAIWTESSYKFRPEAVQAMLASAGFRVCAQWIDAADPFALTLAEAVS